MDIRFDILYEYAPFFMKGVLFTIGLSIAAIIIGSIMGLFVGLFRMSPNVFIRKPFEWYINFLRGTPLLVQIMIVHLAVMPLIVEQVNPVVSAITALSLNTAAYIAEIFRGGIQSIQPGQMEAARSLGLNHVQAMTFVIIPQAFKHMIPALGNELINLIKDSSLVSIIAVPELMYWGRALQGQYYRAWEAYISIAILYFILTYLCNRALAYIEKRI